MIDKSISFYIITDYSGLGLFESGERITEWSRR